MNFLVPKHLNEGSDLYLKGERVTELTIPSDITKINQCTFYNCKSLRIVNIPNHVTEIGTIAFDGCTSLQSINIPNSVTSIGNGAFGDCTGELIVDNYILAGKDYTSSDTGKNRWISRSKFTKLTFGENV